MISKRVLSVLLLASTLTAFGQNRIDPVKATANGVGSFGFELFNSLYEKDPKDPVAISPISIAEAVTLATFGAEKETKSELESLFLSEAIRKEGGDVRTLSYGLGKIRSSLREFAQKSNGVFEYSSANSLWANSNPAIDFKFKPAFEKTAREEYGAETKARDFAATEKVEGEIVQKTVREANQWVSQETKEKITKLLSELGSDDVAIILNAVYAKGKFKEHFSQLEEGEYTRDGAEKPETVTYMTKEESMGYFEDNNLKAFSFKVEEKNLTKESPTDQVALDILVPKSGKLSDLTGTLSGAYYEDVVAKLKEETVELTVPAGKVEQKDAAKLKDTLKTAPFDLVRPFSDSAAQFGPLGSVKGDLNLYINDILTKTFYEMTPFGFEAAAATAVVFARESAVIPQEPVKARVDSAALHVVRHIPSGLPLFIVEYDSPVRYTEKELVAFVEEGEKNGRRITAKVEGGTLEASWDPKTDKRILGVFDADGKLVRKIKDLKKD